MLKLFPFRYHLLFLVLTLVTILFKFPYFSYPFVWDELQLAKQGVIEGHFSFYIPLMSDPFETYGHPPGVAFIQALWAKIFSGSILSMRILSLLSNILMFLSLVFLGEKLKSFTVGLVAAVFFYLSNIYFPLLISLLPPSYEIATASLLLAYSLDNKRKPILFGCLGILAFCMREPNLAYWLPYTISQIALWKKDQDKTLKSFPWECVVTPLFAISHFSVNYFKSGYWIAHPTIISGNAFALLSVKQMTFHFGKLLWKNLGVFGLSSLLLSFAYLFHHKRLNAVLKKTWKVWIPLLLLLGFYLLVYRDFAHRDFANSFSLIFFLLVLFFFEAFSSLKKFKVLGILAFCIFCFELFWTKSYHGSFLKKQYFQKNTILYQKAIKDLKTFNIRGHYIYVPWPISHMLYKPWLGWTERLPIYIADQADRATIALTSNATAASFNLDPNVWKKFHETSHGDLKISFYKRR